MAVHDAVAQVGKLAASSRVSDMLIDDGKRALFRDPLLEALFAPEVDKLKERKPVMLSPPGAPHANLPRCDMSHVRAHFFNEAIKSTVSTMLDKGGGAAQLQVVALGAGYDTRPWLASLGMQKLNIHWFHVDVPVVLESLRADLAAVGAQLESGDGMPAAYPLCVERVSFVGSDLSDPDEGPETFIQVLEAHGFDSTVPTVWLCEGILYYLAASRVPALVQALSRFCPVGSTWVADMLTQHIIDAAQSRVTEAAATSPEALHEALKHFDAHLKWGVQDPAAFGAEHGWPHLRRYVTATAYAREQGRQGCFSMVSDVDPDSSIIQSFKQGNLYMLMAMNDQPAHRPVAPIVGI